MPCYNPLPANRNPAGGRLTIYSRINKPTNYELNVPCGRCIGCRLDQSKQWAIRLVHESQLHAKTSFVTLTYDDKRLPEDAAQLHFLTNAQKSLSKRHLQLFLKRLRFDLSENGGSAIKYFACGEYGEKLGRPHYHIALFGEDFRSDRYASRIKDGTELWRSRQLEKLWPFGYSTVGKLETESAMYVAAYVTKKVTGDKADWHYRRTDEYGQDYWLEPEFALMSRGGRHGRGLSYEWFMKFGTEVMAHDEIILRTKTGSSRAKVPRYYDNLINKLDDAKSVEMKFNREQRGKLLAEDNTPARLAVKETVTIAKMATKKRLLETS